MKVTFYGQNSLALEIGNKHIIVDPFITGNDLSKDKVDIKELKADYILLTHAHEDHVLDAEAIAKNTGAKIVSNYEITKPPGCPPYLPSGNELVCKAFTYLTLPKSKSQLPPWFMGCTSKPLSP